METITLSQPIVRQHAGTVESLYEAAFPAVASFVAKMNGSFDDARDIFHDALVIFYEKDADARFVLHTSPEAYVVGIAKHLWMRKYSATARMVRLNDDEASISIPHDYYPSVDTANLLALLQRTGKRCLDLLQAFYYAKLPVKNIARRFGLGSEHSASVQKYKCLEKVRDTVKENALRYEDFFE